MRMVFALVFLVGLALAGLAARLVQGQLAQQEAALNAEREAAASRAEVVEVYALSDAVKYGDEITEDKISKIYYVKEFLPEGVFTSLEEVFPEGPDKVRLVLQPMGELEPLLAHKVTEAGSEAGLVTRLEKGMRAFAIRTDVESGVSGFLRPGDRVDVYWTGTAPGATTGSITRLIGRAVEIMAVDQTDNTNFSGTQVARTITVRATVQQVAALAQAQATGRLTLALVGVDDIDTPDTTTVVQIDQKTLLDIDDEPAPVVEEVPVVVEERVCTTRTRKGGELVVEEIPCRN